MNTEQKPETIRLAEQLRDAINMLECDFADDIDPNDLKLAAAELESLHTRVQELETLAAPLNVWQQAIDAELVNAYLGVAPNDATFEGARKVIHELICWHIDVATNPATNGGQRLTDAKPIVLPEPVAAQVRFKPENDTAWSSWKVCAVGDAREIEAYTLANGWNYEVRYLHAEQQVRDLLARDLGVEPQPQADALDAERWRFIKRKLCLTGNGDGTCAMQALNLPARILGWPDVGELAIAQFLDAAIDAAIAEKENT